jgi:hypothetical protein
MVFRLPAIKWISQLPPGREYCDLGARSRGETVGILALATCDDDPLDPLIAGPLEPGDLAAKEKHVALREVTVRVQATAIIVPVVVLFSLAAVGATAAIIYKAKHK